jgi:hypothetical protein
MYEYGERKKNAKFAVATLKNGYSGELDELR